MTAQASNYIEFGRSIIGSLTTSKEERVKVNKLGVVKPQK